MRTNLLLRRISLRPQFGKDTASVGPRSFIPLARFVKKILPGSSLWDQVRLRATQPGALYRNSQAPYRLPQAGQSFPHLSVPPEKQQALHKTPPAEKSINLQTRQSYKLQ